MPGVRACTAAPRRRGARGRTRGPHRLAVQASRRPGASPRSSSSLPGLYNVYNATAAASIGLALGATLGEIEAGLGEFSAAFGRFERIATGTKTIIVLLIKNPAAANEALRTFETGVPPVLVVALNDGIADGRDVSWIWDVDFEPLLPHVAHVIASGDRAAELGLRLVYGGLPEERLEVVPALEAALDRGLGLVEAGTDLVVLPDLHGHAGAARSPHRAAAAVRPYWEGRT